MSSKKTFRVVKSHEIPYTDKEGKPQTKEFRTSGPNGAMKLYPGGSAFLGMLTVILGLTTPAGEILVTLAGLVARIRVDGEFVIESTLRREDWFDDEGKSHDGAFIFEMIGDESRIAFAAEVAKSLPALAKRVKSARAALAKRAA